MEKDCKNLNSCCKLELENIFISCFNNSSLHYWVTFEKNILDKQGSRSRGHESRTKTIRKKVTGILKKKKKQNFEDEDWI